MPKASVIIPCYNAERFIEATVASVLAQTMPDFELICVDNNSSDGTFALLSGLAAGDARIRVISEDKPGEGPARDAGRAAATGEWLYFLDADDIMETELLSHAIARGEETEADVVIFRTNELDDQTGEFRPAWWAFRHDWIGDEMVFSPAEHPERILNSFQNWVHNKLFRASFLRENGITVQHVHRTADLLFTCRALTEAKRIALLDEYLHQYRVNNPTSALFSSDSWALDFYEAFLALRERLEECGTWELYHDSFVNWAGEGVAMNLARINSYEGFCEIVETMKAGGLEKLDLLAWPREKAFDEDRWERIQSIKNDEPAKIAFTYLAYERAYSRNADTWISIRTLERNDARRRVEELEGHIEGLEGRIEGLEETIGWKDREIESIKSQLSHVEGSVSFRLGRTLTAPLRFTRDRLGGAEEDGS